MSVVSCVEKVLVKLFQKKYCISAVALLHLTQIVPVLHSTVERVPVGTVGNSSRKFRVLRNIERHQQDVGTKALR